MSVVFPADRHTQDQIRHVTFAAHKVLAYSLAGPPAPRKPVATVIGTLVAVMSEGGTKKWMNQSLAPRLGMTSSLTGRRF